MIPPDKSKAIVSRKQQPRSLEKKLAEPWFERSSMMSHTSFLS
ncbi:hypothetical protein [Leptolyngbya sp. GGD]|nr:hypothetical protein [Leptolyngbya sp. GGD]MCY6493667.1 hypothetical protein [Leptolyngbya sp. GGD]